MKANCVLAAVLILLVVEKGFATSAPALTDFIAFGDAASETSHSFSGTNSEVLRGGLGEPARRLLPGGEHDWEGGRVSFTLKVDPIAQNYATIRLWGSDAAEDELILFCEGKQIGYRHLGDVDLLDFGSAAPAFQGRFFYNTTPLPQAMTRGRSELHFEIRSIGPTWPYASSFAQYQKPMTKPTRGIYDIYAHTNGFFVPPAGEKEGDAPANPPVRQAPGAEVMDELKARVNGEVAGLLKSTRPLNEMQIQFLARAYFVKWTPAYRNELVIEKSLKGLDALFTAYRANPELAQNDPATPNPGWFEFGPAGQAIWLLAEPLKPFLDVPITNAEVAIPRHTAYAEMLRVARDWHRQHRRLYSNQTMINDLYGIYLCNRGLEIVDPENALSEGDARRYLYESVGLEPWRDSDPGPGSQQWGVGANYWQLTAKGLTKELGYVGYYGEVLDWVTSIYDATRPAPGRPGDERIRERLEKIAHTRAMFRYPGTDEDGFRAMRIEGVVGWRDVGHYPGDVAYAERSTWDASSLFAAAATLDPAEIGYAQQMFGDNQFYISLRRQMAQSANLRVTAGLLEVPGDYELLSSQPPVTNRLPMTPGGPNIVFSDEEDGVVAVRNGDELLYASLYWRARNAVNFLARVHYTTPTVDRLAVVSEDVEFEPDGRDYTRPDWINFDFRNGGPKYPVEMHSALAGEKLPIARIPPGVKFNPGDESVYAGKGEFYQLRYGNYLIGMNMTTNKTFKLKMPDGAASARELVSGQTLRLDSPIQVAPRSTVVLWLGKGV